MRWGMREDPAVPSPPLSRSTMIDIFDKEHLPPTPPEEIDAALARLSEKAAWWAGTSVEERIGLLERVMADTRDAAEAWVRDACLHKGISFDEPVAGEEWFVGPALTIMANALRVADGIGR